MAEWGEVTRIVEMTRLTAEGEPEKVYRHSITSKGGVSFTVDISEEDMTLEKAEPILAEKARQVDQIKSL